LISDPLVRLGLGPDGDDGAIRIKARCGVADPALPSTVAPIADRQDGDKTDDDQDDADEDGDSLDEDKPETDRHDGQNGEDHIDASTNVTDATIYPLHYAIAR
jgi:hypothetical protein